MSNKPDNKLRCKKCNSSQIYIRLIKQEIVCKRCGAIYSLFDKEKKGEN